FVCSRQKTMIINAYKAKMIKNPEHIMVHLKKTLTYELGIGQSTIYNTILEYQRTKTVSSPNKTKVRIQLSEKVDDFDKYGIRRKVHQFWHDRDTPTLDKILVSVNEDNGLPNFSRTSLFRLLKSMDFRRGRPIYYLDETWVNAEDVNSKVWVDKTVTSARVASSEGLSTGVINPTGKGKRLIVSHISSEDGFVPGGLLCFESKKNTHDYHDEMNGDSFRDWLEGVLPKLKDNAVIVMDNAPYHSVKIEKCPTTNWRKADIIAWLQSKGEQVDNTMLVVELLDLVKKLKPFYNNYVIDEMVKANNKIVLRLPPYHCELNAIELAWAVVKKHVKDNNKTFKLQDIKHLLIEEVNKEEEKAWSLDNVVEDLMSAENQSCVLTIGQSDTDDDSDDDDEDFRYLSDTD
ncbi:DDE 3 domain-containing protein, partial [Aphis craccivora]